MTRILDRLPIYESQSSLQFGDRYITIRRNQIVVWVGVDLPGIRERNPKMLTMPALLDTGNNFDFSIQQRHLRDWAGLDESLLPIIGAINIHGTTISRHAASVWLYPNKPSERAIAITRSPFRLTMERGIAVYPNEAMPVPPRLPLLGLPAFLNNGLNLWLDSGRREVSAEPHSWRNWFIRLLGRI